MESKELLSMSTGDALKKWDLVVILSGNESMTEQCKVYLEWLCEHQNLPLEKILVLPDPPGPKAESFGAIGSFIKHLEEKYGHKYREWKILAIMNGGYNLRMPFCVNKSKLFTALPISKDGRICHLFDVKLKLLSVYIPLMPLGSILITCSDDIETYTFDYADLEERVPANLTAIGHPSSIQIGTSHGVYIVDKEKLKESKSIASLSCLEILQKPSRDLMAKRQAIVSDNGEEAVITDSVFWISGDLINKILATYISLSPLQCEVNIYRDVLPWFGSSEDKHHEDLPELTPIETTNLLNRYKSVIRAEFENYPIEVLVEKKSNFYHFGTVREHLNLICCDEGCKENLSFSRVYLCSGILSNHSGSTEAAGVMMYSKIEAHVISHSTSIVEFCRISTPIVISNNVILSHCSIKSCGSLTIPPNVTMFTIFMDIGNEEKYCTMAFGCDDDMKLNISRTECRATFLNNDLRTVLKNLGLTPEDVFEFEVSTMWDMKLFPISDTMESSFLSTLELVRASLQLGEDKYKFKNEIKMSLNTCLSLRSYKNMLNFQESLITG